MAYSPKDNKERVLHRLKIVQGHLKKVFQMIEDDSYCIDIIHQSQAVQRALSQMDNLILEEHLNSCVHDAIKKGDSKKVIKEVMNVFEKAGA